MYHQFFNMNQLKVMLTQEQYESGVVRQDAVVFTQLTKSYHDAIYKSVYKVLKHHQTTEEVVQDTFLKVWRNGARFDQSKGHLYAWIVNIAKNTAIDSMRSAAHKKSKKTVELGYATDKCEVSSGNSQHFDLQKIVNRLPQKYQEVIWLFYFEEYSQEEISKELNIPLGTVKTRMRGGIKRLRELYL